MPLEIRQLRCLVMVLEAGNFSRGAAQLGITQQAVSQLIRKLETMVGAPLLERGARQATPTAVGKLLARHGRKILAQVGLLEAALARELGSGQPMIRLGAGPTASMQLVTETLLSMKQEALPVRVDVISTVLHNAIDALLRGELDLFVGIDNGEKPDQGLARQVLGMESYCVIAGAHHPLAKQRRVSLKDLARSAWVMGHHLGTVQDEWRNTFLAGGLEAPGVEITTSSLEFCKTMLISNPYLTLLPLQLVEAELENGTLKSIGTEHFRWRRPIALLHRRQSADSPPVQLLISRLTRSAAKIYRGAQKA